MGETNETVLLQRGGLESECQWRSQVSRNAVATLGLEGLHFTDAEMKQVDQFVSGEIDLVELRRIWDEELLG